MIAPRATLDEALSGRDRKTVRVALDLLLASLYGVASGASWPNVERAFDRKDGVSDYPAPEDIHALREMFEP